MPEQINQNRVSTSSEEMDLSNEGNTSNENDMIQPPNQPEIMTERLDNFQRQQVEVSTMLNDRVLYQKILDCRLNEQ